MIKPQTNIFSKYCEENTQNKSDIKYTQIVQGPYKKKRIEKNF
jgi:hypothetical protein